MRKIEFEKYLANEKRSSPHTVKAYVADIGQFEEYLVSAFQVSSPEEVSYQLVRSWIVSLMESGTTARSVNRKLSTLKTYFKFLKRQGAITANPMLKIQSPKTSKKLPVFVESSGMENLFEGDLFADDFSGKRDKLLLEMLYCTGIRLSELINMKSRDVDFSKNTVKVLGKRNKERFVPLAQSLIDNINEFIQVKNVDIDFEVDYLFILDSGKKMYEKFVYRTVNNYLSKVSSLQKKSPHVLRHTFATHMLNNGAELNTIKEILGHANLSATQVYTHNTIDKLKEVYKQAHPRG